MIDKMFMMFVFCVGLACMGCAHVSNKNEGQVQSYPYSILEASWIREGQPIEYDGSKWYPLADVEVFLDSEVFQVGEYKGVQIFIDKLETKPYQRLYTKFGKNKFRYYEKLNYD